MVKKVEESVESESEGSIEDEMSMESLESGAFAKEDMEADDGEAFNDGSQYSGEDCVEVSPEEAGITADNSETPEERKKRKRIELLDKRIKVMTKKKEKCERKRPEKYERLTSDIKNKHKRQEVVIRRRMDAKAEKKVTTLKRRKLREELGEEAVPKEEAITIEKMRVPDETMITDANDEELLGE